MSGHAPVGTTLKRVAAWGAAIVVLLGVFALYTRPQMMVTLGDMVWACFQ